MVDTNAYVFEGRVMHHRLHPRKNKFTYGIYYLCLSLSSLEVLKRSMWFAVNKFAMISFYSQDHGARDQSDLKMWILSILDQFQIKDINRQSIRLITLPRVMGYIFNPVSFWLCFGADEKLRAVLCEVNNTFGETHSYLCYHENGKVIDQSDIMIAKKLFHVSPFLPREGSYEFRFTYTDKIFGAWIDYKDQDGKSQLLTSLTGKLMPLSDQSIQRVFFKYPWVTLKAIYLIHWQAIKIMIKGISYIAKPKQMSCKVTTTEKNNLNIY